MPSSMKDSERGTSGARRARELARLGFCAGLLFVLKAALAPLPNIEAVTLLVILYTLWFGRGALLILCIFVTLEGTVYGFHLWWIAYLYVWVVLWLAVTLAGRRERSPFFWAALGGIFGLSFGFLCSFPYLAAGGIHTMLGWWAAGIPFDLIHGFANFALILVLFSLLDSLWKRANSSKTK